MMDEGVGGGRHDTILSSKYKRIGIGLFPDQDEVALLAPNFS